MPTSGETAVAQNASCLTDFRDFNAFRIDSTRFFGHPLKPGEVFVVVGMVSGVRLWDRACNIWKIVFIDVLRHANTSFFHVPVKSEEVRRRGGISGGWNGANGSAQIESRRSEQNLPMENWSSSKHRESWCLDLDQTSGVNFLGSYLVLHLSLVRYLNRRK